MHCLTDCKPALTDTALLLMRVMLGVVFAYHGSQKMFGWFGGGGLDGFAEGLASMGFPFPKLNAILAASAEFGGGLALILGLLTRLAVIPMTFTMGIAVFVVHWGAFSAQHNGVEYPLTLGVMLIALGLLGPGRFSIDARIGGLCRCGCCQKDPGYKDQASDI